MKKRFLSVLMVLCMVLTLMPMAALAEGDTEIQAGTTTLANGSYVLKGDVTLTGGALTIPAHAEVTIDLQGHKLTNTAGAHTIVNNGMLTINDSGENGIVDNVSHARAALYNAAGATVTLNGGTFDRSHEAGSNAKTNGGNSFYTIQNQGNMTINAGVTVQQDGSKNGGTTGKYSSLFTNGWQNGNQNTSKTNAVMTINGGTFSGGLNTIKNDDYGELVITGGTFKNFVQAAFLNWNIATVEGGTFDASEDSNSVLLNGHINETMDQGTLTISGGTFTGKTIVERMSGSGSDGIGTVVITGGTFNGTAGFVSTRTELEKGTISVSGGTFNKDVSDYVAMDYECTETENAFTVSEKTTIEVKPEAKEDTVTATVEGVLTENPGEGVTAEDNTLTVDATVEAENINASEVTISPKALTSVQEAGTVKNVEIKTNVATLTVNAEAWNAITENATSETETKAVTLGVKMAEASDTAPLTYTLTAKDADDKDVFSPETAMGDISVTVLYTKGENAPDPEVYYVSPTGSEKMESTYENETLTWIAKHFSDYVVVNDDMEVMTTTATGTTYGSFKEAIETVKPSGGTITLLKDVDLSDEGLYEELGEDVTISGSGKKLEVTAFPDAAAFLIWNNATLTLDGVSLTIHGAAVTADNTKKGVAFDLLEDSHLALVNGTTVTLEGLDAGIRAAGEDTDNGVRTVLVDKSTLMATEIGGYFSNTGTSFSIQNGAKVDISDCGTHGLSADEITIDDSTVSVKNAGWYGVTASTAISLKNGASVTVDQCGTNEDATAPVRLENGDFTIDGTSKMTVQNCEKGGQDNNKIYLAAGTTLKNQGTITGEVKYEELAENQCRIIFMVDGQTYAAQTIAVTEGTAKFTEPAAPSKSGYTFTGWNYGSEVSNGDDSEKVLTLTEGKTEYTYTAKWSAISYGGSSGYAVNITSAAHGTVTASPRSAAKGTTVTLTVKPDSGYVLDSLSVTDKNGDSVSLNEIGSGKYTFTMPGSSVTVKAAFAEGNATPFTDVSTGDWYYDAVKYVYEAGMMNGTTATSFGPEVTTTRAMIVTILYRLEGEPAVSAASVFTDVAAGQYYTNAVAWASSKNIVGGYGDGKFGPEDTITREQLAAILYRYAQYKGYDVSATNSLNGFADVGQLSSYAEAAMQWANGEGLITGVTGTTLAPTGSATRAQVATILMRFCENVAK